VNLLNTLTYYFFKIRFNIIHWYMCTFTKCSIPFRFLMKMLHVFFSLCGRCILIISGTNYSINLSHGLSKQPTFLLIADLITHLARASCQQLFHFMSLTTDLLFLYTIGMCRFTLIYYTWLWWEMCFVKFFRNNV
jgi:hypothetical protein